MNEFELLLHRNDLADLLNIPRSKLTYILYIRRVDNYYSSFEIPKKSGGVRHISAPNTTLKYIQRSLADALWRHQIDVWGERVKTRNISHAFEKQKSIITNAKIHRNKHYIVNLDLEDFFDSFHFGRVLGFFEKNRDFLLPHDLAVALTNLVCYNGHLPQGSPCSPIITNLICQILDYKVLALAKKYKVDYTRYADDLSFSTNNSSFPEIYDAFLIDVRKLLLHSGFTINDAKTRFTFRSARQEVTGLTVNKKINVANEYYKKTRAMAYTLYKTGEFHIDGKPGSIHQLEGRFAFIHQVEQSNYLEKKSRKQFNQLSSKEKDYQKFIFYKSFINLSNPVLVTEGETDILYIKSALKKHYRIFPNLITRAEDGKFEFHIKFYHRTLRTEYFFGVSKDGADTIQHIYDLYSGQNGHPNLAKYFKDLSSSTPNFPVILLFDNEMANSKKPLKKFLNHISMSTANAESFRDCKKASLTSNLFLSTNDLVKGLSECEIEDLFNEAALNHEIKGKTFSREAGADTAKHYGKSVFASYISENFESIDFDGFIPYLERINEIIDSYKAVSD